VRGEAEGSLRKELVSVHEQLRQATESAQKGMRFEEQHRTASEALEQITREQKVLQERFARIEQENAELRKKHQTSEERLSQLTAEVAKKQAPDVAGQIVRLQEEKKALQSELEAKEQSHKQAIARAEESQREAERKITELEREKAELKKTKPAGEQKKSEPVQREIGPLEERLRETTRELETSRALNEQLRGTQDGLTHQLAEEKVAREAATEELSLLSSQQVQTLHDSLQAAFPPMRRWGGSEIIRFRELTPGNYPPPLPPGFWLFRETVDKGTGKTSVYYNNGRGEILWDPSAHGLLKLVDLVKEAQGVIWIRGTPVATN
jgi:chromosome segregation ATPase